MNALTSTNKTKQNNNNNNNNSSQLSIKKNIILFLFLSLLVDNCILMYLEITILYIYNFTILHGCLFGVFYFLFLRPRLAKNLGFVPAHTAIGMLLVRVTNGLLSPTVMVRFL